MATKRRRLSGTRRPDSYLRTIEQAVLIGTKLPISWFRGHSAMHGSLTPSVYRIRPIPRGGYRERWIAERFRLRAGSIQSNLPAWNDYLRWLLLMQHHGSRTRLLDWSESILTALYFAVQVSPKHSGEIWCARPDALNNRSDNWLCSADEPQIRYLAAEAFSNEGDARKRKGFAEELGLSKSPQNPMAFFPPMDFPRMSAQASRFTIHPRPTEENLIESLLQGPQELVRYEIPGECKASLRRDLTSLEVTAEMLFRSLDGLALTIEADVYAGPGDEYPSPPLFD